MDPFDMFFVSLVSVLQQFPLIMVWLVGLGLAVYHRRRFPRVSRLVLIAIGLLLPIFLVGVILDPWLALLLNDRGYSTVTTGIILVVKSYVIVNINALAWILILSAIFNWRASQATLDQEAPQAPKQRHGCLTVYLIIMVIANFLILQVNALLALIELSRAAPPDIQPRLIVIFLFPALGYVNIGCALGLWNWKRWGFYGVMVSGLAAFVANLLLGSHLLVALAGLLGIVFLYGVLQIGDANRGWSQLE